MFASYLARRMSLTGSDRRTMVGSVVAVVGVALSVCTMILTVAVSRGFGKEVTARLLAFEAPLTISAPYMVDETPMVEVTSGVTDIVQDVFPGVECVPVWQTPAMVKSPEGFDGLMLKNLAGENHRRFIGSSILRGNAPDRRGEILLSSATALSLGVDTMDRVDIAMFIGGAAKLRRATVSGIYDTHFVDYDANVAFVDSATIIGALNAGGGDYASGIDVFPDGDPADFQAQAMKLQGALSKAKYNGIISEHYRVDNFTDKAAAYLGWLALLDVNVMVIIGLMAFIAAFTLTSSMIVIVLEKVRSIGVLKALGAGDRQLQTLFLLLGMRLLLCGIAVADIISVALIVLQYSFHVLPLDPHNYYLDYVPVDMTWNIFLTVNLGAVVLGALAMLVPVKIISTVRPVQAISFE